MYREIVEKHRSGEKLRCIIIVAACLMLALAVFFMADSKLFRWGIPAVLVIVAAVEVRGSLNFDRDLAKMKQAVEAASDADMDSLLKRSANLDSTYFISDLYVLNFTTMKAYARSTIRQIESREESHTDSDNNVTSWSYTLQISYGDRESDKMTFMTAEKRNAARSLLEN
jgi:hypothetical protein